MEPENRIDPDAIFTLAPGERIAVIGMSGSGKTALSCFLLEHHPRAPVIIYDTKGEPKFDALGRVRVVSDSSGIEKFYRDGEVDYIVMRPNAAAIADQSYLDSLLWDHYNRFPAADCFIDELASFGIGSHPRMGMTAIVTRGRSRGITTITCTQRPAWIPIMTLSEAQAYYVLKLQDRKAVARVGDFIPEFEDTYYAPENRLERHGFFYFSGRGDMEHAIALPPVPLDSRFDRGYVDMGRPQTRNWL